MDSQQTSQAAQAAIQNAVAQGMNPQVGQIMVANLDDTTLMGCVGASVDDLDATEATIVNVLIDQSGSMMKHADAVITEYNRAVEDLKKSKGAPNILWSIWTFADDVTPVHGYQKIQDVQPLTRKDYSPMGGTALYEGVISSLTAMTVYGQQLSDNGIPNRRILFILSDGDNNCGKNSLLDVKSSTEASLRKEMYIFAFAGFGDSAPELAKLAVSMGIPANCVTNGTNPSELRRIFQQMSQSVSRVSQGAASTGGFF